MSAQITANFFRDFDLSGIHFLHCFVPIERFNEVDTRPIFQRIWSEFPQIQTVVPRVNHDTDELESLKYGPDMELVPSRWRINEPTNDEHVEPREVDMVLVPLLCFDVQGHRIGYGKGYYDRFLSRCRSDCTKIGLSMFERIDRIFDAHSADIRLNYGISPSEIYEFADSSSC